MNEPDEDELVLRLTVEHLRRTREWPELRDLHRRIHQELHEQVDVREVAKRLAPHPFLSVYHDSGDTFAPPLHVLAWSRECDPLVDGVLSFIIYAHDKYLASSGETQITEAEFAAEAKVERDIASFIRELVSGVPFLTHGGGS